MSDDGQAPTSSATLRQIGHYLIALADRGEPTPDISLPALPLPKSDSFRHGVDDLPKLARIAHQEYIERGERVHHFNPDLFAEPAWDVLLDLFISKVNGLRISITSACIAARVPPTTALRWIGFLEENGLVERVEDRLDRRRTWVELTDAGLDAMTNCLRERARVRANKYETYVIATPHPIRKGR